MAVRRSTFALRVVQSRHRVELAGRTYHRDREGQFSSGGGGVRGSLANAGSIGELNTAIAGEAKRITGKTIEVDMAGSDLQVAREHGEGVLQALERFPAADLAYVGTYGPGAPSNPITRQLEANQGVAFGVTMGSTVRFNNRHAANPDQYRAELGKSAGAGSRWGIPTDPRGVAIHEMGHVVAHQGSVRAVYDDAVAHADRAGMTPALYIGGKVSRYAASSMGEYAAEAFADVMLNGSGAADVSKSSFKLIEQDYGGGARARTLAVLDRTYKRDKDGQFSSTGGGGGVRDSLAEAKNAAQVGTVLASELSAVMGRNVHVDLKGMNVDVAREHAEGVLRVAERFPSNELGEVTTFGARGVLAPEAMGPSRSAHAVTTPGPDGSGSDRIAFNVGITPATYRRRLERGDSVPRDPTGVAIHEMGHVVSIHNRSITRAGQLASRSANAAGEKFFDHIGSQVSKYGAASEYELTAEGFAATVLHGTAASKLSQDIYDVVVQENGGGSRARSALTLNRTYTRDREGKFSSTGGGGGPEQLHDDEVVSVEGSG